MEENKMMEIIEGYTLRRLLMNINNDLQEDGDTGVHLEMTIKEYIELLVSYSEE